MSEQPPSAAVGNWEAAARKRGCYCGVWDTNPAAYEKREFPLGYCGICERCGVPGHLRHFPGPVPYTGAWCDKCYRVLAWTWPFRSVMGWVYVIAVAAVAYAIGRPLIAALADAIARLEK